MRKTFSALCFIILPYRLFIACIWTPLVDFYLELKYLVGKLIINFSENNQFSVEKTIDKSVGHGRNAYVNFK